MSHDDHAKALGRWLDQPPGTPPPEDVDAEVVQAIYALRPELAPAPRVTADDILASVTRGPLAQSAGDTPVGGAGRQEAEVVPFPGAGPDDETEESDSVPGAPRRGRFLLWAGGTSGVGLALVAVATLLLVAYPTLQNGGGLPNAEPDASPAAAMPSPAPSPASSLSRQAPAEEVAEPEAEPAPPPPPRAAPRPRAARQPIAAKPVEAEKNEVYEMDEGAVVSKRAENLIPELAESREELDAVAAAAAPEEPAPAIDLAGARKRAVPVDRSGTAWRAGVDGDTLARIEAAIAAADAARATGDRREAADLLAEAVQPPARAGQHVAGLAAMDYLALSDAAAAVQVAQRGIGLSSANTPERAWLLVLLGDARARQGETATALDLYEQAASQNAKR